MPLPTWLSVLVVAYALVCAHPKLHFRPQLEHFGILKQIPLEYRICELRVSTQRVRI